MRGEGEGRGERSRQAWAGRRAEGAGAPQRRAPSLPPLAGARAGRAELPERGWGCEPCCCEWWGCEWALLWAAGRKPEREPSSGGIEDRDRGGARRGRVGGGEEQREQAPGRERSEGPGRRARRRPVPGRLREFLGEKTGSAPLVPAARRRSPACLEWAPECAFLFGTRVVLVHVSRSTETALKCKKTRVDVAKMPPGEASAFGWKDFRKPLGPKIGTSTST